MISQIWRVFDQNYLQNWENIENFSHQKSIFSLFAAFLGYLMDILISHSNLFEKEILPLALKQCQTCVHVKNSFLNKEYWRISN